MRDILRHIEHNEKELGMRRTYKEQPDKDQSITVTVKFEQT